MPRVILDWDSKYNKAVVVSDFLENIRAKFSVPNDGKKMLKRTGAPTWYMSEFNSPISATGRFEMGMYFEIINSLKQENQVEYEISTTEILRDQLIQSYPWKDNYTIPPLSMPLREYQELGVKRGVHMGYGTMIVGTAGGKTLLMASLIQTIRFYQNNSRAIVILPSSLVEQTYKEFKSYGIDENDLSMWSGERAFTNTPIILAGAEVLKTTLVTFSERKPKPLNKAKQSVEEYNVYLNTFAASEKERKSNWNSRKKQMLNQLKDIDLLLIDEVHGLRKGNVINDVISLFNTRHRFGFTGTLPQDPMDQWNITGIIGPTLINVNSAALRELNYISQVQAQVIQVNYKNPPVVNIDINDPTKAYLEECDFLYHNEYRNKIISKLISNFDKNALIMVDKIDHGETLEKILTEQFAKRVYFIRGSVEMEERENLRALMEKEDNIVCIAMSRIFAVGINIKNLHYVVFAQGGKAKVTLIQSIGRGLRLHELKDQLIIIDIADNTHYGRKHLAERITYYKDEKINYDTTELFEQ